MRLAASDIYSYYQPSRCARRFDCRRLGLNEAEPSPYTQVLEELGKRHEADHRQKLEPVLDLSGGTLDERLKATAVAIARREKAVYQPAFQAAASFDENVNITGIPDFLLLEGDGYVVRDCKISRRVNERDHPEIVEQLDLYGWLIESRTGSPPARLEVLAGNGETVIVPYRSGESALPTLQRISSLLQNGLAGYVAVGWSKCQSCAYRAHCWNDAVARKDHAVVYRLDQGAAETLREMGITNYEELLARFTPESLGNLKRPYGKRQQRIGRIAESVLSHARALVDNRHTVLAHLDVPESENYVVLDLEGLPPQMDETEKIYLWGMQIFGAKPGECIQAVADFGPEGDKNGWDEFMGLAKGIFDQHGDIPFVHWYRYEKDNLEKYIERYGDPHGIAARVQANLCDLLVKAQQAVVLPTYSYSIKQIEKMAGYRRKLPEANGDWSMAQYVKAIETQDADLRTETMDLIKLYNREDLEATWAVQQWLQALTQAATG